VIAHPAILERVIEPQEGDLPLDLARYFLKLDFPPADHVRYAELSARAQQGVLSPEEATELDDYLNINAFLMIAQSKARWSLRGNSYV
jgi:hypothetical protein